jgi:hypothetical protein
VFLFEFSGTVYELTESEATLLAESLHNYAKGVVPEGVKLGADLGGGPDWTDGALALADWIEDVLVGRFTGVIPLEGKAAEAAFWTLRLMQGLGGSAAPTDMAALRDALGNRYHLTADAGN